MNKIQEYCGGSKALYNERAYNRNLKLVESIIGNRITNGGDLYRVAKQLFGDKFLGVYDHKDKIPKLKNDECVIINQPTNQHWIGRANVNGKVYQYDSFNRPDFVGGFINGDENNEPDQRLDEANCGARVLAWLTTILSH